MQKILFFTVIILSSLLYSKSDKVYFTTGFKLGELTDSSVVVWTRLCHDPAPVPITHNRIEPPFKSPIDFDNDMPVNEMDGAVAGAFGYVRVTIKSSDTLLSTAWQPVSSYKDYTFKKKITGLTSNQLYEIVLQGRKKENSPITEQCGTFRTAPYPDEIVPVLFTSSSCQYFWDFDDSLRGLKIYDSMRELHPLFHCQTGDFVYYDKPGPMAYTVEMARHKWHAMNSWPSVVDFYAHTPLYLQKDDHDMLRDDASPSISPFGELSFDDGLSIWYEQAPLIGKPYRTFRWGKDLQIWLVEGREFRTDNWELDGPAKSIWGQEQKNWFAKTVESSDATFKVLLSPTPIVGPDRAQGKTDNHANKAFQTEGDWLRKFMAQHHVFSVNGDRHWQYVSVDDKTGVLEFSQGASSDSHAQGWKQNDVRPEHRFLRVKGGFLAVEVRRQPDPVISFRHYAVDGHIVHEEIITKESLSN
jgi:alkaline phosphatase D